MVSRSAVSSGALRPARRVNRLGLAIACALLAAIFAADAFAQSLPRSRTTDPTLSTKLDNRKKRNPNARMLVTANEMIYDNRSNKVHAVGQVQIYYDGNTLEADRVSYDRNSNRVFAEGNVRYKTTDGNIVHSQSLELTQDFKEGFVNSLLVETPNRTRFAATRADRTDGTLTVYQRGIYTACEPCKNDPQKPPLWQVKAARIIHNEGERKVYYENATIEVFGYPLVYLPFFYHPDPTVKRQSGFLQPTFRSTSRLGVGVEIPYFWSIAPNMDSTLSVTPYTLQGPLVKGEFRHRLENGAYMIRAAAIDQLKPNEFAGLSGQRDFRGSIDISGEFNINSRWVWGFDGMISSDRSFQRDYNVVPTGRIERTSEIWLTGQGDRSYFDLRGMHFRGLSEVDRNDQLPLVLPVLDYSYYFKNPILGGELSYKINVTSLTRQEADFAALRALGAGVADPQDPNKCLVSAAVPANCFIRGIPGEYTRMSAQLDWRKTVITTPGIVVTPFVRLRTDVASVNVSNDAGVINYLQTGSDELIRAMPTVGFETRWPFISVHSWGTQTLEPIVQTIFRPSERLIGRFPNEDAQSLVFDDSTLFAIDKYSGWDRVEGGSRVNYGVQYTANVHRFGMVNVLFGQSYQFTGDNSFAQTGFTDGTQQIGSTLQSGLEDKMSDYVARVYFQPTGRFSFITRYRFDKDDLALRRFEFETRSTWDRLQLSTIYAYYDAQPLIGYIDRREALFQTASYKVHDYWTLTGAVRYDLDRGKIDFGSLGVQYADECIALSANYIVDYTNLLTSTPVQRFVFKLNLRTMGQTVR